jgi:hypothetical protein
MASSSSIVFGSSKIQDLDSIALPRIPVILKADMLQMFKDNKVLFIRDPMMRILFRDYVKMLREGYILSDGETSGCRIDSKLIKGKLAGGSI